MFTKNNSQQAPILKIVLMCKEVGFIYIHVMHTLVFLNLLYLIIVFAKDLELPGLPTIKYHIEKIVSEPQLMDFTFNCV